MPKRILYVKPSAYSSLNGEVKAYLEKYADEGTIINVVSMPKGPKHLEYLFYQDMALQEIFHAVKKAELSGYEAAIIGCFDDPGLHTSREICDKMFVIGPGESAMQIAVTLGEKFSIIVGRDKLIPQMMLNVRRLGYEHKLASFRSIGISVPDLQRDHSLTAGKIRDEVRRAISEDKAEVVILGCTMEFGFFEDLQNEFGVPVLDVALCGLKYAEFMVSLGQKTKWFTSKIAMYASPPKEEILDWNIPRDYAQEDIW
jgi:allantoin racemase